MSTFMKSAAVSGWVAARGGRPLPSCCGRAWPGWSSSPRRGCCRSPRAPWRRTPSAWCLSRSGSSAPWPPSSPPSMEQGKWVGIKKQQKPKIYFFKGPGSRNNSLEHNCSYTLIDFEFRWGLSQARKKTLVTCLYISLYVCSNVVYV